MSFRAFLIVLICAVLFPFAVAAGENWPQWRGPAFNGSTTEAKLPDKIGPADNLAWAVDLPGIGSGTPIVWDNRVFVSAIDRSTKKLTAMCFDRLTGKPLWQNAMGDAFRTTGQSDLASPSAITDGQRVFFYFGTGELSAFDMDGKPLWSRSIPKEYGAFNVLWIYGSSPLLWRGKLYVQVLHRNTPVGRGAPAGAADRPAESYLLAIDPATGKELYRHARPTAAHAESQESYATPVPYEGKDRREILIVGGDCVTGHDPDTGKELWRCGGWNPQFITHWRLVPSVTVAGDVFVACTPKGGKVFAIKAGGSGDVTATHIAWETKETTSDVPTPLYYQGNLYVLDGDFKKGLSCLDPQTGHKKWTTAVSSRSVLRSSPTGADGKIYLMNEGGDVWILSAADGRILCTASLGSQGRARASVAAAQGMLLIRTGDKLWAFARK